MALDSVFANPPPLVGAGNKETLKHDDDDDGGEKESFHEDTFENATVFDDPPPRIGSNLLDDDEEGEVEEGEIVESDNEAPRFMNEMGSENRKMMLNSDGILVRKKKKKKKKKKKPVDVEEEGDEKPVEGQNETKKSKKAKKNWYVDHDRVNDEEPWFQRSPGYGRDYDSPNDFDGSSPGGYGSPYDSPRDDFDDRIMGENTDEWQGRPPDGTIGGPQQMNNKKRRGGGASHGGGPEKKRSRMSRQQNFNSKGRRREGGVRRTMCKFYLEGKCNKGSDCTFLHDGSPPKKPELCKFYLNGFCAKGDKCLFMHKEFPCKFFHTGVKCYSAEQCKFSHEPLTEESRRMLERCLDANRDEEALTMPQSPTKNQQRPSLLGSPPQHIKELADNMRKIPSLFDIRVGTPNHNLNDSPLPGSPPSPSPNSAPVRPNFYSDTLKSPGGPAFPFSGRPPLDGPRNNSSPPRDVDSRVPGINHNNSNSPKKEKSPEMMDSSEMKKEFDLPLQDVDMRRFPELRQDPSELSSAKMSDDENSDRSKADRNYSSDSESESKRPPMVPIAIPTHLPKKQRELFLRIQQQQRVAENSQDESDKNDSKKDEDDAEKEENWYTSDEDDENDGDQPLTAVLKKLQQEPPSNSDRSRSSTTQPAFDIANMIRMICKEPPPHNQLSQDNMRSGDEASGRSDCESAKDTNRDRDLRMDVRDPRIRRMARNKGGDAVVGGPHRPRDPRNVFPKENQTGPRPMRFGRGSRLDSRMPEMNRPLPPPNMDSFHDPWGNGDKDMRQQQQPMMMNCGGDEMLHQLHVQQQQHQQQQQKQGVMGGGVGAASCSVVPPANEIVSGGYTTIPYKLHVVTVVPPNYGAIKVQMSMNPNDPRFQNDPRLKAQASATATTTTVTTTTTTSASSTTKVLEMSPINIMDTLVSGDGDNHQPADLLKTKFPALTLNPQNGKMAGLLGSPPRDLQMPSLPPLVLPPIEPPNPFLASPPRADPRTDPRTVSKPSDTRPAHADPRLNRNNNQHQFHPNPPPPLLPPPPPLLPPPPPLLPPPPQPGRHAGLPTMTVTRDRSHLAVKTPIIVNSEGKTGDSRIQLKHPAESSNSGAKKDNGNGGESTTKPKGGSYKRRGSFDYASPLGFKEVDTSAGNGYNRRPHQRAAAGPAKPGVVPLPAKRSPPQTKDCNEKLNEKQQMDLPSAGEEKLMMKTSGVVNNGKIQQQTTPLALVGECNGVEVEKEPEVENETDMSSVRDVFKTIDPTASPFC